MIDLVSRKAHLTQKAAREAIDTFLEEIAKALKKGDRVVLSGFGTFRVVNVKDKPVIIPRTREKRVIKAHRAARFHAGKPLQKSVR